jgi:hypothetical protein
VSKLAEIDAADAPIVPQFVIDSLGDLSALIEQAK